MAAQAWFVADDQTGAIVARGRTLEVPEGAELVPAGMRLRDLEGMVYLGGALQAIQGPPAPRPGPDPAALVVAAYPGEVEAVMAETLAAGCVWRGHRIQVDDLSQVRITAQVLEANLWLQNAGDPLSLRWADADRDMAWVSAANALVPINAADMVELGQTAAAAVRAARLHARALKDGPVQTRADLVASFGALPAFAAVS